MNNDSIYVSLDEARTELARRWNDVELKKRVEAEREVFFSEPIDYPFAMFGKHVASPDNGTSFFFQCAKYINASPIIPEYLGDRFLSINEEKKGLGRLRLTMEDGSFATADIIDFHDNEQKEIRDVITPMGEKLVDFHHRLMEVSGFAINYFDNSKTLKQFGGAQNYYYQYLLNSVCHGVIFETFEGDDHENSFTEKIVRPAVKQIKEKFNLKPLIVRVFPPDQNDKEDFYWWSFPKKINDWLVKYLRENNFSFKKINL
jgi:hypothetical protein